MSERKVLNKYFPADFDPAKIPRRKMPKDKQEVIRLMAPFSMRCTTCGEYIYKGKKFNARKETVQGEDYYGIRIFRFYIKCTQCSAEITFKTDPKNSDYNCEHGAMRNFEPWRDTSGQDEDKLARMEEEENNPMAALENKAVDSQREMQILDALQDLKTRNARIDRAGKQIDASEKVLDHVNSNLEVGDRQVKQKLDEFEEKRRKEELEDEQEVRRVFGRAFVAGVPDIELDEANTSEDGSEGPATPKEGDEPGPSNSSSAATKPLQPATTAIKRKLDAVEPTPASLLSASSRSIVEKSFAAPGAMGPPLKKKGKGNSALAAKLGIKLKK